VAKEVKKPRGAAAAAVPHAQHMPAAEVKSLLNRKGCRIENANPGPGSTLGFPHNCSRQPQIQLYKGKPEIIVNSPSQISAQ
jgi:hypothetical protein